MSKLLKLDGEVFARAALDGLQAVWDDDLRAELYRYGADFLLGAGRSIQASGSGSAFPICYVLNNLGVNLRKKWLAHLKAQQDAVLAPPDPEPAPAAHEAQVPPYSDDEPEIRPEVPPTPDAEDVGP